MRWSAPTRVAVVGSLLSLLLGCGLVGGEQASAPPRPGGGADGAQRADSAPDPDEPLAWGPTRGEVEQARELVRSWSVEQLAGQVIVGRYHSTDPRVPAEMVRDLHLAGVSVTADNVVDEDQVRETTAAIREAAAADGRTFPAVIGVDEEGGSVAHLRGVATTFPAFRAAGDAVARDREAGGREGRRTVRTAARASGLELRDLGFTWVFAPVADVTIGTADPTIGSRSPSTDPRTAAVAAAAAVRGYNASGVVSTTKHFPGHGGATADSHHVLPVLETPLEDLRDRDLLPFRTTIRAGAPAIMMSHLDVSAVDPGVPATLSPALYDYLRDDMGFEGVAITDSLGMGAVAGTGFPAVRALRAGADLLLMPSDTRATHRTVVRAIDDGRVPRERAEEAASRVVALQLWQQRRALEAPVPADVTEQAQAAATALVTAAW